MALFASRKISTDVGTYELKFLEVDDDSGPSA